MAHVNTAPTYQYLKCSSTKTPVVNKQGTCHVTTLSKNQFKIPFNSAPALRKIRCLCSHFQARKSLVAQLVKNPPAMRETWV